MILITGSSGFVAKAIIQRLSEDGHSLRLAQRTASHSLSRDQIISNLAIETPDGWDQAMENCETLIHCAGQAHQRKGISERQMMLVNGEAVGMLADRAKRNGIQRFIHLSSVRAITGASSPRPINEDEIPAPIDVYGRSKLLGEKTLMASGINGAILRLPLVIGSEAKGNFGLLLRAATSHLPLPFKGLTAQRSLVGLSTVSDAISFIVAMPSIAMQTMLIAEDETASVSGLVTAIRRQLGRKDHLFTVPDSVLKTAARLISAQAWDSLAGPLVLKPTRLAALGWQPPSSLMDVIGNIARENGAQ
jgi:nucleoside-diphosphate-sugar epimerase